MNILHHKSWHVYNKDNIERVRKDEAEAEAEAKKKQNRVILAESEARLELLRKKANAKLPVDQSSREPVEHVNLFKDLEQASTNPEHEAEQKAKDEKWEKQITMYLDKGAKKEDNPWYVKLDRGNEKYIDQHGFKRKSTNDDNPNRRKREALRINDDPLDYITKSLKKREEKKHKSHKHSERKSKSKSKSKSSSSSSTPSIEELRARRLERERKEQSRLKALYLDTPQEEDNAEMDDRKRGYNSQFNREETSKAKEYHHRKKVRYSDEQ